MIPRKLRKGEKFGSVLDLWNQLIDHLTAMRLVAGKGIRISHTPAGVVIAAIPGSHGRAAVETATAHGSFIVSMQDPDDKGNVKLEVSEGFVCVNGKTFTMKKQQIAPEDGLLCVKVELDEKTGNFQDPVLEYGEFDAWHYPVALIRKNNDTYDIMQYPVTVATFMLTKMCAFAKAASNEQ